LTARNQKGGRCKGDYALQGFVSPRICKLNKVAAVLGDVKDELSDILQTLVANAPAWL
jgi:hypothetical protein